MTQEDKELLLKDLCARLPYGVKALYSSYGYKKAKKDFVCSIIEIRVIADKAVITCSDNHLLFYIHEKDLETLKPYLRPMSSMTEEEKKKLQEIIKSNPISPFGKLTNKCDNLTISVAYGTFDVLSYLLSRHFDVHCLIENGLALEAPEGMYYLKEK